jgi:hypothetical protein
VAVAATAAAPTAYQRLRCTSDWCAVGCQSRTAHHTRPGANEAAVALNSDRLHSPARQLLFCSLYLPSAAPAAYTPALLSSLLSAPAMLLPVCSVC